MRRQGEFYPVITLLADDDFDRHMRRVLGFHTARGWRIKRALVVRRESMPVEFKSLSDIERDRGECAGDPPPDLTPIEVLLDPPRALGRQGAHERRAQLGTSVIGCSASEHAVELQLTKESGAKSLASLRELVQALRPPVAALGSSLFRGPSLAELREATNSFRVELEKIYLSREVLGDKGNGPFADLEAVAWEEGLLVSGNPGEVTNQCWPILRKWAYSVTPASRPSGRAYRSG
ncbi:hypothetical protein SAMN02745121_06635 [Nannocystis exedens]|uniref:Uncharacterized protein n=2 Tax=Nannocystis exedens TaxID=54 RepID=A0A1I2FHF7_9BACT|nr:hypothetical protein NAEX_03500 [Nannocystis exedens]SFF04040.1 hypothetical protein SAMN02745121_06635 [Nannocystis exedens]